ncbi:MAG: outer membrane protein [Roseibium sp.]
MDILLKRLSLTGFAVVLSTAGFAADLPTPVIEHIPAAPAVGGFYLRGDIGYKVYGDPNGTFDDYGNAGFLRFQRESMDNAWMVGVGVGYQFNNHLRGDITFDYETAAKVKGYAYCGGCTGNFSEEGAKIDVFTTMINGYIDIGTWNNFTPYVGAGVGTAYVRTKDTYSKNPGTGSTEFSGSNSDWNFAWALMAGAEYAFTPNWSLDAGYRYKNLGTAKTVKGISPTNSPESRVEWADLTAHEFRLGARYTFNKAAAPVYYQPQGPISSNF